MKTNQKTDLPVDRASHLVQERFESKAYDFV